MSWLVVVLLGGLWASILLPGALRARRDASPMNSIDSFERSMDMLALRSGSSLAPRLNQPPGRHVMVLEQPARVTHADTRGRMLQRRRLVLGRLFAATAVTGLAAVVVGGVLVYVFTASALALSGYVALLVHLRARRQELRRKLRRLPRRTGYEAVAYGRRVEHG